MISGKRSVKLVTTPYHAVLQRLFAPPCAKSIIVAGEEVIIPLSTTFFFIPVQVWQYTAIPEMGANRLLSLKP